MSKIRDVLKKFIFRNTLVLILLLIVIIMSFVTKNFFSIENLFNILRQVSIVGIMAIGMTYVLLIAEIDLSVGAILSLCASANVVMQKHGFAVSILVTLGVGIICGLINGLIISRIKVNAFMTTIATQILFMGVALLITKGKMIGIRPERIFSFIGKESILGFPVLGILLFVCLIIFGIILQLTVYGRRIYAVGFNIRAAYVSGLKTSNIILSSYLILGVTTAIAGIALTSRLTSITPIVGSNYLFDVLTVVVLGGTTLSGGVGNIGKTFLGIIFYGVVNNSMLLAGMPFELQQVVKGLILLLAIFYNEFNRRRLNNVR
jgi:ribose/xylose/arabinose/galactoside ABC-type transport system permease subunit